jgi:uncharacterized membrane protein YqaE (UPF0057 family)
MIKKLLLRSLLMMVLGATTVDVFAISLVPRIVDSTATVDKAAVDNALTEFKSLSRKERKSKITEAKKALKDFKKNKSADADTNTILLCILAILLPPLAIYLKEGEINAKFWIGLLLTLLIWLPGVIYALLVVLGNA